MTVKAEKSLLSGIESREVTDSSLKAAVERREEVG